jgi:hypothetical protein
VLIEALGTVTTMASVAVKSRLDNVIVGIHFADGAYVKRGDLPTDDSNMLFLLRRFARGACTKSDNVLCNWGRRHIGPIFWPARPNRPFITEGPVDLRLFQQ